MRPAALLKKRLQHRCFPVNFAKFLKPLILQNTSGGCFCCLLLTNMVNVFKVYDYTMMSFKERFHFMTPLRCIYCNLWTFSIANLEQVFVCRGRCGSKKLSEVAMKCYSERRKQFFSSLMEKNFKKTWRHDQKLQKNLSHHLGEILLSLDDWFRDLS